VRGLENAVEHAVAVGEGRRILPSDLPASLRAPRLLPREAAAARSRTGSDRHPSGGDAIRGVAEDARETWSLADVEREHILRVLRRHHGNSTAAAKQLGISRTTLWRKLREYGIPRAPAE